MTAERGVIGRYLAAYLGAGLVLASLDAVWITLTGPTLYRPVLHAVLIDGFRANDAQTAHNNLDLPVPLDAMANIEVLHGAGSTLYGADALGGVASRQSTTPATSVFKEPGPDCWRSVT